MQHEVYSLQDRSLEPENVLYSLRGMLGLGGILAGLAAGSFWFMGRGFSEEVAPEITLLPVVAQAVQPVKSIQVERLYTGEIAARQTSELGFERSGELVSVQIEEGALIPEGTVVAELDTRLLAARKQQVLAQRAQALARLQELQVGPRQETIAAAQAQVEDLQEQLALAQLRQERRRHLLREGAISQEQLDEVAFETEALSARLRGAASQLSELQNGTRSEQVSAQAAQVQQLEASLAEIEVELCKSRLIAPFTGQVARQYLDVGTVVGAGQPVIRLVDQGLEARVGVPVALASRLEVGTSQRILVNGGTYPATIAGILPEVENPSRTVTVVLTLEASTPAVIGETMRLSLPETLQTEGFWVPTTALLPGVDGLWALYSLEPQPDASHFTVMRQEVEVLHTEGEQVLVRGTVQPGDQVVQEGVQRLTVGQRVSLQGSEGR